MGGLKGGVAVITGGGSGIGRSIALAFARHGGNCVIADIDEAAAAVVAGEIEALGTTARAVGVDVADPGQTEELAERAFADFGRVDVLCNNAGISWRPYRSILETSAEDWRRVMGVNFQGVVNGLDAFLPRMRAQSGRKHIVNTASLGGFFPMEGHCVYSASKAAVIGLSEAIAGELAPFGFGVTILCPGLIPTNLRANTERLAGAEPRTFAPVATPMIDRLATFPLASVEPVGEMVCRAVLANQLYLHTAPVPGDMVADRMARWFGSGTIP